ncbi:hypothetical protein WR25_11975 [Diploscapter pachys]|uniref:Lysosomal-associated transmembrane protein 4B n=1 Tax=Diploscapter pachys TaxID=2018661 RepID=A0A2A2KWP9_9BILA|nr:hypothetical protein WR25_11975 [Diploscapter pachys]
MSTDGMTEKAHLLNQSQDEQQQPGEVDGGQHYGQPIQPQGPTHVKWFNHDDDKYKCCCSSVHVKTGAMIFGVLCMIAILLDLLNLAGYMLQLNNRFAGSADSPIGITWVMGLCSLACICILFVGIRTQRSHLLIPFLVLVGVYMLCTFVGLLVILFQAAFVLLFKTMNKTIDDKNIQIMPFYAIMLTFYISALAIEVWVFNVVYRCMKYLSDAKKMDHYTLFNNPV